MKNVLTTFTCRLWQVVVKRLRLAHAKLNWKALAICHLHAVKCKQPQLYANHMPVVEVEELVGRLKWRYQPVNNKDRS